MVIGLTGPTGSGKTQVGKFLGDEGFKVLNLDAMVHKIYESDIRLINQISQNFDGVVINGKINRKRLSNVVFKDKKKLKELNGLVLPAVYKKVNDLIKTGCGEYIVLDAPTLFESGLNKVCDVTLSVISNYKNRFNRITVRDKMDKEAAKNRIESGKSLLFFILRSDYIIINNGDMDNLKSKSDKFVKTIKRLKNVET